MKLTGPQSFDDAVMWRSLTPRQRDALAEMAVRPLHDIRAGWGELGQAHSRATVQALVRRGLAEPQHHGTSMRITARGTAVLQAGKAK